MIRLSDFMSLSEDEGGVPTNTAGHGAVAGFDGTTRSARLRLRKLQETCHDNDFQDGPDSPDSHDWTTTVCSTQLPNPIALSETDRGFDEAVQSYIEELLENHIATVVESGDIPRQVAVVLAIAEFVHALPGSRADKYLALGEAVGDNVAHLVSLLDPEMPGSISEARTLDEFINPADVSYALTHSPIKLTSGDAIRYAGTAAHAAWSGIKSVWKNNKIRFDPRASAMQKKRKLVKNRQQGRKNAAAVKDVVDRVRDYGSAYARYGYNNSIKYPVRRAVTTAKSVVDPVGVQRAQTEKTGKAIEGAKRWAAARAAAGATSSKPTSVPTVAKSKTKRPKDAITPSVPTP